MSAVCERRLQYCSVAGVRWVVDIPLTMSKIRFCMRFWLFLTVLLVHYSLIAPAAAQFSRPTAAEAKAAATRSTSTSLDHASTGAVTVAEAIQTHKVTKPGIVIVHGFKQPIVAYHKHVAMFTLSSDTWIVKDFDLVVRCDSFQTNKGNLKRLFEQYPHESKTLIHEDRLPNYKCGQFSALDEMRDIWEQYSIVVWINPDTFVTPLAVTYYGKVLAKYSEYAFYVTRWQARMDSFNTDVMVFRPPILRGKNTFSIDASNCTDTLTEVIYANMVKAVGSYVEMFDGWHGNQAIDPGGMWHTHRFKDVQVYMDAYKKYRTPFLHLESNVKIDNPPYVPKNVID